MNISRLNLNSLLALDVLLSECHVSRAAEKLHITQSALSVTLSQLRDFFNDDLLVRGPKGMIPTPRALQLQPKLHAIIEQIQKDILESNPFEPKTMQRTFTIGMNDYTQLILLPLISKQIHKIAPGVRLNIQYLANLNDSDLFENNSIDIGIGTLLSVAPVLETDELFTDSAICVVDKNKKVFNTKLTLGKYLSADHVSLSYEKNLHQDITDQVLKQLGHKRNTILTVQNMMSALQVIKGTDLICTIAKRAAMALSKQLGLKLIEAPFDIPSVTVKSVWHKKYKNDEAHIWLRSKISEIAKIQSG